MNLIYRGYTIPAHPAVQSSYVKPRALNWRYQTTGGTYADANASSSVTTTKRMNWRYTID